MAKGKSGRRGEPDNSGMMPDKHPSGAGQDSKEEQKGTVAAEDGSARQNGSECNGGDKDSPATLPVDDRLLRLQADFDNYRKRVLREKEDIYRRANEDLMTEILPVLDHMDLALAAAKSLEGEQNAVAEGFRMVAEQLMTVLGKFGLTAVEAASGMAFDPNIHEAILHLPSVEIPENGIVSRTRGGYMLSNRLLRAAQVVVSSGEPGDDNGGSQA